jgi:hypothetical protein
VGLQAICKMSCMLLHSIRIKTKSGPILEWVRARCWIKNIYLIIMKLQLVFALKLYVLEKRDIVDSKRVCI